MFSTLFQKVAYKIYEVHVFAGHQGYIIKEIYRGRNINMGRPIYIDGSVGEGGGQILRTSLSLAALLGRPVEIANIRVKRRRSGLMAQHLAGVRALATITDAETEGAEKRSTRLVFKPRTIKGGTYRFDIGTAGSVSLLLAAVLPPLLFAGQQSEIVLSGGTHVPFSPPYEYMAHVFLPALAKLGVQVELELVRSGWYPKGGGKIRARVEPCKGLTGIQLASRGMLTSLQVNACSANLPEHIGRREIAHLKKCFAEYSDLLDFRSTDYPSPSGGNMVFLQAGFEHTTAGFSALGKRGKPAEQVAEEVCRAWHHFIQTEATLDLHLADQLILYMALAKDESFFIAEQATGHLATNIDIIKEFLPVGIKIEHKTGQVQVKGSG
jgi:RNA 3'-terminal phosphate cyclase (ATP)